MNKLKRIGIKTKRGKRVFTSIKYPTIPLSEQDLYLTSTIGDRLDILAEEFYSDKELWWIFVAANPDILKGDSWFLKPGTTFRVPPNSSQVINLYEAINNGETRQ